MKRTQLTAIAILLFSQALIFSCRLDVPIKEMTMARSAIKKAHQAMAEKYDMKNLRKSIVHLYKAHRYIKKENVSKAKKEALESLNYANAAIIKSLPLAVKDTLAEAMTLYSEAEMLYAEKYAPEELKLADKKINETDRLKSEKKLWDSLSRAREARETAQSAKNICLKKIPSIKSDIDRINTEIADLLTQDISKNSKSDLAAAKTTISSAITLLTENNVKKAVGLIDETEEVIKKIKISLKITSAKERIKSIRDEADKLKNERGIEFASEDIEVVISTLNEAESLLEQNKIEETLLKISDAENSLKIAKEKTIKGLAYSKSKSAERLLNETIEKDKAKRYKDDTDKASTIIKNGNTLLGNGSFKESILKFEEAESLLNSLSVAGEKDYFKDKEKYSYLKNEKGAKIYKVTLNRKDRDCLWRIAQKVYKNAKLWPLIYMANKDKIKDPDLIFPGQTFIVPPVPKKKKSQPADDKNKEIETEGIKSDKSEIESKS